MNNSRNKKLFMIGGGFLLVVILWSIQGTLAATKPSPRVERFQNEIATLEESVKYAQSENEIRSIEEQLKLYYQMATLVATMQPTILSTEALADSQRAYTTQLQRTQQAFETQNVQRIPIGIIEDAGHAGFLPKDFQIGNAWFYRIEGKLFQVYAGADGKDPKQGAVVVSVAHNASIGMFLTPTRHGLVRVVEVEGLILTLRSEDGTIFYFNVPGRKFTLTVDEVVPTITPVIRQQFTATSTPTPLANAPYPQP
ncbi:MAG: hypothetical protein AB1894_15620 [Chloroflexota bacterium]